MASEDLETLATLNYYMLEGYYRHVQVAVLEATTKFGNDPLLQLFKGLSLFCEGQVQDCIREVQMICDKTDVKIAAHLLLIQAHKNCRSVDKDSVIRLDEKVNEMRNVSNEIENYWAALVFWHLNNIKLAKEFVEKSLKINSSFNQAIVLKGWIELTSGREVTVKKAGRLFTAALNDIKDPFAVIGRSKCMIRAKKFSHALDYVNQMLVRFPSLVAVQVERIRIYMAQINWEQVIEASQRLLNFQTQFPEVLIIQILHSITQNGEYASAVNRVSELVQAIDRFEPQNARVYYKSAQVISRIAGNNVQILQQTMTLIERAISLDQFEVAYIIERGYQLLLLGKSDEATEEFQKCMNIDESSVKALIGSLMSRLIRSDLHLIQDQKMMQDISDQLDFLTELQDSTDIDARLFLLKAIFRRVEGSGLDVADLLESSRAAHFQKMKNLPLGVDYFRELNPSFLQLLVDELFYLIPSKPLMSGEAKSQELKTCDLILSILIQVAPGIISNLFSKAKILFISGEFEDSMLMLERCLQYDVTYKPAHLLRAEIELEEGNIKQVVKYLETALSYNFEIRDHPKYLLLKARTQIHSGDTREAMKTLKLAMSLPGVRKQGHRLDKGDRLSIFLQLAEVHSSLDEHHEAAKVMQDAITSFQGSSEQIRLQISNARLSLSRGDVEQSLSILRSIKPNQSNYIQAKEEMAEIFLKYRKDRKLFTSCYRELADTMPCTHTWLLLGDAYMRVQEPKNAIKVYEEALRKRPHDGALASKVGQALIQTHDYKKAITYYETALRNGQRHLRVELAKLLLQLKNFKKAERILQNNDEDEEVTSQVDRLLMLAEVYSKIDQQEQHMQTLIQARDVQSRVLKRVQMENPTEVDVEKRKAANICSLIAQLHISFYDDVNNAIKCYQQALIYCEADGEIMMKLAKLYLREGDHVKSKEICVRVLQHPPSTDSHEQANLMVADVLFEKGKLDDAEFHYHQLIQTNPDHYQALARLIELLRRSGKLKDVPELLEAAEDKTGSSKAASHSGFQYCKGIYEWFCGKAAESLKYLNRARFDSEWNLKALELMIRICLNPDQQTLGGEAFESLKENDPIPTLSKQERGPSTAISTAEKLIKEFRTSSSNPYKTEILESHLLMSTKNKQQTERALNSFLDICQRKRDYVPALLGTAIAYQILKQTPRSRNQLKRISKMAWRYEDAEDLESAWLLLADLYITSGKYDMATELLKKCLHHNKSCSKAYEYLGFIFEKEQSYQDAASNYLTAWQHNNENNPVIGYKLAFNYLKAKKHVEAIDISHKVLKIHPGYPRIKKEILDKARSLLRT